jgi:serine/threonine protein kinase
MKSLYNSKEEVNKLREVRALKRLSSFSNIINLIEVLYDEETKRLALVFELMEMNLYEAIKGRKKFLKEEKVKNWIFQILISLNYMHRNGIFHRDIKPENILLKNNTNIKLADLGSCKGIYGKQPFTEYISTRWYRAPECLLTDGYYNYKMDIWGLGCVFFEMLTLFPLFPGDNEIDQVNKIHNILGSPNIDLFNKLLSHSQRNDISYCKKNGIGIKRYLSHVSDDAIDVISKMLIYDPEKRFTAKQCLTHSYFRDLYEMEERKKGVLMISFNNGINDSLSYIKNDDSLIMIKKKDTMRKDNNLRILPNIKVINYNIVEDDENENSKHNINHIDSYIRLPRIGKIKYGKENGNLLNSNEFKNSLKHNLSNHSIDGLNNSSIRTHYIKQLKKRIINVKKNYVSPYSKKNIENNINV